MGSLKMRQLGFCWYICMGQINASSMRLLWCQVAAVSKEAQPNIDWLALNAFSLKYLCLFISTGISSQSLSPHFYWGRAGFSPVPANSEKFMLTSSQHEFFCVCWCVCVLLFVSKSALACDPLYSVIWSVLPHLFFLCTRSSQADRLWDPPLLCTQHDGPRTWGLQYVPQLLCKLLHQGSHYSCLLSGPLPSGGPDGSTEWSSNVYDHHCPGITAAAGPAELWVLYEVGLVWYVRISTLNITTNPFNHCMKWTQTNAQFFSSLRRIHPLSIITYPMQFRRIVEPILASNRQRKGTAWIIWQFFTKMTYDYK